MYNAFMNPLPNPSEGPRKGSRAQIVATIGPSSDSSSVLRSMVEHQADVIRINFSWGDLAQHAGQIAVIREIEKAVGRPIPIIADLPGPRVQEGSQHMYDRDHAPAISVTDRDKEFIRFAVEKGVDYVALSFVGSQADIAAAREVIRLAGGKQKIVAKIERAIAVTNVEPIIAMADAVMIARGDLGNEVPLEQIPFIQADIIRRANIAGTPVITATQMMFSMVNNPLPTRAEVTDVSDAIYEGSDAVMLSDETAAGKYPVEAVAMMERIILETERRIDPKRIRNPLVRLEGSYMAALSEDAAEAAMPAAVPEPATPQAPAAQPKMGTLVVLRHHESEWNKLGLWTGQHDAHLTDYGFEKSGEMGLLIKDIDVDQAFASMEVRSIETLSCVLNTCTTKKVPTEHSAALNERDYGDYTGKNKWDMEKLLGEEQFEHVRRDWDCPIPNGETLKMVYERAVPYFLEHVLPLLRQGKNVLVVSHGNTIRALMKYIENISDADISQVEMLFGGILIYDLDFDGHLVKKEVREVESKVNA